jgi:hypothetical protein
VLTIIAIVVLLVQVKPIGHLADQAADSTTSIVALPDAGRPLIHAIGAVPSS